MDARSRIRMEQLFGEEMTRAAERFEEAGALTVTWDDAADDIVFKMSDEQAAAVLKALGPDGKPR
jgi:hypothetical protein